MASSINASTTAGVVTTADTSGVLQLQTAGTTAISIDASQAVSFTNSANLPNTFGFKNRIINGAMVIDQRYAGAAGTAGINTAPYGVDRWWVFGQLASKFTYQQNAGAVTPPTGFSNYFGMTSSSAYAIVAGDRYVVAQTTEGFNTYDLDFGKATAKTITISFWVYSSLTGTFGGSLQNYAGTRSYPFTYSISVANTWEQKTVTIAGDTSGTWVGASNAGSMTLFFSLGSGSTYSGTAGAWATANYTSATGATSVVGTSGATFYITGVQLEKGATATSFDYRPYGTELALCQRYYYRFYMGDVTYQTGFAGYCSSTTNAVVQMNAPVQLRSTPTLETTGSAGSYQVLGSFGNVLCTSVPSSGNLTVSGAIISANVASGLVAGNACILRNRGAAANEYMALVSEL